MTSDLSIIGVPPFANVSAYNSHIDHISGLLSEIGNLYVGPDDLLGQRDTFKEIKRRVNNLHYLEPNWDALFDKKSVDAPVVEQQPMFFGRPVGGYLVWAVKTLVHVEFFEDEACKPDDLIATVRIPVGLAAIMVGTTVKELFKRNVPGIRVRKRYQRAIFEKLTKQ